MRQLRGSGASTKQPHQSGARAADAFAFSRTSRQEVKFDRGERRQAHARRTRDNPRADRRFVQTSNPESGFQCQLQTRDARRRMGDQVGDIEIVEQFDDKALQLTRGR